MALTNLEDAVLSLLGEANQGEAEITLTGTGQRTRSSAKKTPRVTSIAFEPRRSGSELPWATLVPRAE